MWELPGGFGGFTHSNERNDPPSTDASKKPGKFGIDSPNDPIGSRGGWVRSTLGTLGGPEGDSEEPMVNFWCFTRETHIDYRGPGKFVCHITGYLTWSCSALQRQWTAAVVWLPLSSSSTSPSSCTSPSRHSATQPAFWQVNPLLKIQSTDCWRIHRWLCFLGVYGICVWLCEQQICILVEF